MKKQIQSVFPIDVDSFLSILPDSIFRLLVLIVIGFGVGLGYGLSHGISQDHPTRAEYERLKTGMSIVQVESILNRGTEVERSTEKATFVWENPNGYRIMVTFEDDKLTKKQQMGL